MCPAVSVCVFCVCTCKCGINSTEIHSNNNIKKLDADIKQSVHTIVMLRITPF